MRQLSSAIFFVLCVLVSSIASATRIQMGDVAAIYGENSSAASDDRRATSSLFEFSTFEANAQKTVPGFTDPLGVGLDPGLKIFAGRVQFMDILGDFSRGSDIGNVTLPRGTYQGDGLDDLIGSLLASYIAGTANNAFDYSLLSLGDSPTRTHIGIPVTNETTPLSLAGFGNVTEFRIPLKLNWAECPGQSKRIFAMTKLPRKVRRYWAPGPSACYYP